MNTKINQLIAALLDEHCIYGIAVFYHHFKQFSSVSYVPNQRVLKVNIERLEQEYAKFKDSKIDFLSFVRIIILHEIGHIKDPELQSLTEQKQLLIEKISTTSKLNELDFYILELGNVMIKAESNAWNFAFSQVSSEIKEFCYLFAQECMKGYAIFISHFRDETAKFIA